MSRLSDFFGFIRLQICVFAVFMAMSGYLLNNAPSSKLVFVALTSFFLCAGAYSYNNITDRKEDLINRGKENTFASSNQGKIITAAMFSSGFVFSLFLSFSSVLFYIAAVATSVAYSAFRLKKYLFVKNIYTAFGVTQVFLIGAAVSPVTLEVAFYYFMLSFFILIESIISDLRDYEGDKASYIRTLPVSLGYETTRYFVLLLLVFYSASVLRFSRFLVLLPFALLMLVALIKNRPSMAHSIGGYSFIFLAPWLAL